MWKIFSGRKRKRTVADMDNLSLEEVDEELNPVVFLLEKVDPVVFPLPNVDRIINDPLSRKCSFCQQSLEKVSPEIKLKEFSLHECLNCGERVYL